MTTVQEIERAVEKLAEEELRKFREWFVDFDAQSWDEEFEQDVAAGKLDSHAEEALRERRNGRTRAL